MYFHSKLPDVGTTIFTVMSQLATEHNAINLGQGFPDFEMSEELTGLVNKAMRDGRNQYVHMNGLPALREKIAEKSAKIYGASIHATDEITITPGGTYAIYTALTTILQQGDEVIVFEPAYDSYIPNVVVNGAVPVIIPLTFPGYTIPWQTVKEKMTPKTKAIIINSPHNPTGAVLTQADIEELRDIVKDTNIMIVSDEVYEHLVFDDLPHLSMLRYADLRQRSFVCFSFGKTYHCTGWKMGYCIAPAGMMKEFRKVHQFNCFTCDSPKQYALAAYLENEDAYLGLGKFMQAKRDFFQQLMRQTLFVPLPSHGSYFQCFGYDKITDEPAADFAIRLTKEKGVAAIPISAFYTQENTDKVLRFCFAKQKDTLEKAVERLLK